MAKSTQPMQPIEKDPDGITRFKKNEIITFLLNWSSNRGMSLNDLALIQFTAEDRSQLAQLIGYSVSGWGDLSYVDSEDIAKADKLAERIK